MKKHFLLLIVFSLFGEFQEKNILSSKPLSSKIKYFLIDEGVKNLSWSVFFGFGICGIIETIKTAISRPLWGNALKVPLIAASTLFTFTCNGVRYFQLAKNKNIIDQIAEEEESLIVSIEKNNFFDKRKSYFAPNKKKLLARTLFYLSKTETVNSIPEIVAKLERKSKEEVFDYYKSFFDNRLLEEETIIQEEIEKYLYGLLIKFKKPEEMTFSEMTQIIRLFLENKKNIQSNSHTLRFLIQDKSFLSCLENKIKEYQESYPVIFLTKNLKCQTQEKAIIVFFALLEIANKNFYLISPILPLAKESLYSFLKINNIENAFLQHLKNLEELETKKIIEFERTILCMSDQINLYQNSLNTFVSTIKIKNDSVKRLQENIKIQIKRDNDDSESTFDAEFKIKLLMNEINDFEKKITSYEKLISDAYDKIHKLKEQIDYSYSLIKKYKDFLNIVSEIIYYGEHISKNN
jgi:hypothetical protein